MRPLPAPPLTILTVTLSAQQTSGLVAANVYFEPNVHDAARCPNDRLDKPLVKTDTTPNLATKMAEPLRHPIHRLNVQPDVAKQNCRDVRVQLG